MAMQQALARKDAVGARQERYLEEESRQRQGRRETLNRRQQLQVTRRGYICFFLVLALLFGLLFLVAQLNIAATQKGYRLKSLEQQIEGEKKEQESLRLDVARLESPARIEKIATETLKMVMPVRSELVHVEGVAVDTAAQNGARDASGSLGSAATPNGGSGTQ
jgi:cell division protein FtsL